MQLFKWLMGLWDAINRKTDMRILWPICVETAPDLDHAKAAFYFHVSNDPAWINHYGEQNLIEFIEQLKPETR